MPTSRKNVQGQPGLYETVLKKQQPEICIKISSPVPSGRLSLKSTSFWIYSSAAIRTTTQASSWTLPELLDIRDGGTEGGKGSALLVRGLAVMSVLGCPGLSPQTGDGCPSSGSGWSFSLLLSVVYQHWDSYCFLWLVTKGNGEHWHVASPQHLFVGWTRGCHGIRSSVASEPESSPTWLNGRRIHDSFLNYLSLVAAPRYLATGNLWKF